MKKIKGNLVKKRRKKLRKTIADIAKETGLSITTIFRVETEKSDTSVFVLATLADYFGVSTDYLLGRDGNGKT